jgi:hypothetical protein
MNVLIDDDKFQHISWSLQAKRQNKELKCFFSIEEFLGCHNLFNKDTNIYVDSDLKTGIPGEIGSENIFKAGFRNIFLTTSFNDIDLTLYPWIKSIRNKSYPASYSDSELN